MQFINKNTKLQFAKGKAKNINHQLAYLIKANSVKIKKI